MKRFLLIMILYTTGFVLRAQSEQHVHIHIDSIRVSKIQHELDASGLSKSTLYIIVYGEAINRESNPAILFSSAKRMFGYADFKLDENADSVLLRRSYEIFKKKDFQFLYLYAPNPTISIQINNRTYVSRFIHFRGYDDIYPSTHLKTIRGEYDCHCVSYKALGVMKKCQIEFDGYILTESIFDQFSSEQIDEVIQNIESRHCDIWLDSNVNYFSSDTEISGVIDLII